MNTARARMVALTGSLVLMGSVAWGQETGAAPSPEPAAPMLAAPVEVAAPSGAPAASEPAASAPESAAMAQIRQNGCVASAARATPEQIATFIAQPATLLSDYGMTSIELSARVRALVGSDTRALDKAVALLAVASVDQRAAIGSGLGRAAFACQEVNPEYAGLIQSRIADSPYADVKTAFLAATNDIQVAAIAGASGGASGGGGAPGLSGGGVAGPGTAGMGGDDVTPTATGAFPVGNGGSGGISYVEGNGGELSIFLISGSPSGQ
ncbi:hypothetical protein [Aureimonas sp. ME7]|uniref:hypothetical protein n=1 Tax=Aureimonas sp. ME7 TaxID=2744252 RepID=UPI0015FD51D0|nr:hypothetical protein [Aureimonas sp. ME7]